jgi:hypothetical protein
MADNLATVRDALVLRVLGRFSQMDRVDEALRHTLDL